MQQKYRPYRRPNGKYYWQENDSRKQGSLRTSERREAERLHSFHAMLHLAWCERLNHLSNLIWTSLPPFCHWLRTPLPPHLISATFAVGAISAGTPSQPWYTVLLTPISLTVNIVLGLAGIYGLWKKRSGRLEAQVTQNDFSMPFNSVSDFIRENDSWNGVNPFRMDSANCLWLVRINNLSKKKAVAVRVNMPDVVTVAQIEKNQTKRFVFPEGNQIELDDLSPKDQIIVRAWSTSFRPTWDIHEILVSYDEGVARMKPQYLVGGLLYRFGYFMRTIGIPVLLSSVVTIALVLLLNIVLSRQRPTSVPSPTPTPAQSSPTPKH